MDTNFNGKKKMDFVRLKTEIRQKAKDYLDDISEDNLKSFAESTKYIAQSVLENYFLAVDDLYTNGVFKIENSEIFDKFIDFHDGYRAQMKKWASENEIIIGKMTVNPTIKYPELEDEDIIKKPLTIAGAGTLVAVGLIIFTDMWIVVAAELLALGFAAYTYKKSKVARDQRYAFRVKQYENQIELEKARLVNGLITDLEKWLSDAEKHSDSIIRTFGVQ